MMGRFETQLLGWTIETLRAGEGTVCRQLGAAALALFAGELVRTAIRGHATNTHADRTAIVQRLSAAFTTIGAQPQYVAARQRRVGA